MKIRLIKVLFFWFCVCAGGVRALERFTFRTRHTGGDGERQNSTETGEKNRESHRFVVLLSLFIKVYDGKNILITSRKTQRMFKKLKDMFTFLSMSNL